MKTQRKTIRTSRNSLLVTFLGTMSIFSLFIAHPVFGQHNQIVFTENSSTNLTVAYNGPSGGISVVPAGTDSWLVTFPSTMHFGFELDWQEPGDPTLVNDFNIYNPDIGISNTWLVSSEFTLPGGATEDSDQPPDGFTFVGIGSDNLNDDQIDATFNDLEDVAAVPEPATWTAGILAAGAILSSRRRKRTG